MEFVWSMSRNSDIWGVFWTKQVQIGQNIVGKGGDKRRLAGEIRSLLMLGICSFSVLESYMKHCLCLFFMYGSETM